MNFPNKNVIGPCALWHVPHMGDRNKEIGANVRRLRTLARLTQAEVADLLGYEGSSAISKIEAGDQNLKSDQMEKMALAFGCNVSDLLPKTGSQQVSASPYSKHKTIRILGSVQAGLWLPVEETFSDTGNAVNVTDDACPGDRGYFALIVEGTSMNLRFPPGTTLLCCPLAEFPELRDGLYVIVRRTRHGDAEITVKRFHETEEGRYLMPETSDPRWSGPVKYDPEDERLFDDGGIPAIEIIAVVVSSVQKHI